MKPIFTTLIVFVIVHSSRCQSKAWQSLMGTWQLQKSVADSVVTFDIHNLEGVRRKELRHYQETIHNRPMTHQDSAEAEIEADQFIKSMTQMVFVLMPDSTYAYNIGKDKVDGGTIKFNETTKELALYDADNVAEHRSKMKIIYLSNSSLIVDYEDSSGATISNLTYKKE